MAVTIIDRLQRGGSGTGPFAVIWEQDAKLSYITVADLTARDAIEEWKRLAFMRVHVVSENKDYRLGANVTIAGQLWTEVATGIDSGTYQVVSQKNQANGYVGLEANGKINPIYIDNIYSNNSFVVADNAARNALTLLTGDIVTVTSTSKIFVKLNDEAAPHVDADFAELVFPGAVLSVNGQTGAVLITIANLLSDGTNLTNFNTAVANAPAVTGLDGQVLTNTVAITNLQSDVAALQAGSTVTITTWDNSENYLEGNYVDRTISGDIRLFKALVNNIGLAPESNPGTWKEIGNTQGFVRTDADATFTGSRKWTFDNLEFFSTFAGNWHVNNQSGITTIESNDIFLVGIDTINQQVGGFMITLNSLNYTFTVPSGGFIGYAANRHASYTNTSFSDKEYVDLGDAATAVYADEHLLTKTVPAPPSSAQNGQALRWNNAEDNWEFFTPVSSVLVTGSIYEIPLSNSSGDGFTYTSSFKFNSSTFDFIVCQNLVHNNAGGFSNHNAIFGESHTVNAAPIGGGTVTDAAVFGWDNIIGNQVNYFSGSTGLTYGSHNQNYGNQGLVGGIRARLLHSGEPDGGLVTTAGVAIGSSPSEPVTAKGNAINISSNTLSQTVGHGAYGKNSGIFAGVDANIPETSPRSVVIGGSGIKARATDPDNVYVPYFNITQITQDDALTQVIVRNSTTGKIYYKDATSFNAGITNSATLDQVTIAAADGNLYGSNYFKFNNFQVSTPLLTITRPIEVFSGSNLGINDNEFVVRRKATFGGYLSIKDTDVIVYHSGWHLTGISSGTFGVTFPDNSTVLMTVLAVARRTGGTAGSPGDSAAYELKGVFTRSGTDYTLIGSVSKTVIAESQAGWDLTLTVVDGPFGCINPTVTGAVDNIIDWSFEITVVTITD